MCLAVPGKVLEFKAHDAAPRQALVDFAGVLRSVDLTFTPEAKVGDFVIVHVGCAIAVVVAEVALQTLSDLQALDSFGG